MALAAALLAAPSWAALGGDGASITTDNLALRGQLHRVSMVQYEVSEISSDGLVVREYSTHQGQVFAVAWQGPFKPDLRQLLGSYFARFQSAANAVTAMRGGLHRQFAAAQADLVVHSSGRLRAFRGLAYVPSLVPAGVSVTDLQ